MLSATRATQQPDYFAKAVIDSGPLFSALVLHYNSFESEYRQPGFLPLEEPLLDRASQEHFLRILGAIKEKLTTSHVMAELLGLEKARLRLYGEKRLAFWRRSVDLLTVWDVDERLVRLLDMAANESYRSLVPDIGFVDTGLIELALQNSCVLITQDERTLAHQAFRLGVDCRLVKQLVPAYS